MSVSAGSRSIRRRNSFTGWTSLHRTAFLATLLSIVLDSTQLILSPQAEAGRPGSVKSVWQTVWSLQPPHGDRRHKRPDRIPK